MAFISFDLERNVAIYNTGQQQIWCLSFVNWSFDVLNPKITVFAGSGRRFELSLIFNFFNFKYPGKVP